MRSYLAAVALLLLSMSAHADPCVTSVTPTFEPVAPGSSVEHVTQFSSTSGQCAGLTSFDSRFGDIQNQIDINRREARAGIAMAMAAASMGVGGAAAAAGAGKLAVGAGFGDFEGTVSVSAGLAYALSKQFNLSAGISIAPLNGRPMLGISGGATLVLN